MLDECAFAGHDSSSLNRKIAVFGSFIVSSIIIPVMIDN